MRIVEFHCPNTNTTAWQVCNDAEVPVSPVFHTPEEASIWLAERTAPAQETAAQPEPTSVDMPTPGTSSPAQPTSGKNTLLMVGAAAGLLWFLSRG